MKTSKTLLKEEYQFDMLQKSNRNPNQDNHMFQFNYIDNKNNQNIVEPRKRESKLSVANKYITGLVNELKQSITLNGFDDNIFKPRLSLNKQQRRSKRISFLKQQLGKNYKNTNSLTNSNITRTNSLKNGNFNFSNLKNNNIKAQYKNKIFKTTLTTISNNKDRSNSISSNKDLSPFNKNILLNAPFYKKKSIKNSNLRKSTTMTSFDYDNLNNPIHKKSSIKKSQIGKNKLTRVKTINSKLNKVVKFDIPEKKEKKNKNKRRWSEQELQKYKFKKKDKSEGLFSFFLRPEFFEENNSKTRRESHREKLSSFNDEENERLFQITRISNKNILELNDITNDLKKTIVLTPKNGVDNISKRYNNDDMSLFSNLSESNESESEEEKKKIDLEKYRELQKKSLVYDSLDEYNDQDISNYFIRPDAKFLIVFDFFVFISTFYCLLYYPFFLGVNNIFCRIGSFLNFPNLINMIIDVIFFMDFVIQNFIGYYNSDDIFQTYIIYIFGHNLKRYFFTDLIAALPIKTLLLFSDLKCKNIGFLTSYKYTNNYYYLLILLRLIKIVKVLHKNKFLKYLDEQLDKYEHYNNYYHFYKIITLTFITMNFVSCVFIFLGKNSYPSWITNFGFEEESFIKLYFLCNYYLIETVTTVGYGDLTCITVAEKMFGIIIEFIGIIAYSWIVTSISNYVKSQNDQKEEYFNKYKILEDIKMKYPDLNDDLFERINRYIKHKQNNEDQEKNLIEELPISLKNILVYNMYEPIIKNFIFFKNFDNKDFIVRVIFCFKPILAIRNDILIKDGDFIEDIIFIKRGKISLELPIKICEKETNTEHHNTNHHNVNDQTNILSFMHIDHNSILNVNSIESIEEEPEYYYQNFKILDIRKNEHFGDVLMFSNERSPLCAIVKSRKAELFYLKKADALEISQSYPQICQKIIKKSLFNMQQIRRLMSKVIKIFNITNGINTNEKNEDSIISQKELELQSIPTISESKKKIEIDDNGISGLNTIKENDDISEESTENPKNKSTFHVDTLKTDIVRYISKKSDEEYDSSYSSEFTQKSKLSKKTKKSDNHKIETRRLTHLSNNKIEFSDRYSDDIQKHYLMSKSYTPYKPEEINNEIYPNENFMKYNKKNNIPNIVLNKNNDISICSTEISFSISSKYENIDELSDYRYSKTPKLRKKIKSILKDYDYDSDYEFNKYQSEYSDKKQIISLSDKKSAVKKSNSANLIKKKKKKKRKEKSSDYLNMNLSLKSLVKRNKDFNFLEHIHKSSEKKNDNKNDIPTFTLLLQNFIDKEKLLNFKELEGEKEELSKKIKKMKSMKYKNKIGIKHYQIEDDTS